MPFTACHIPELETDTNGTYGESGREFNKVDGKKLSQKIVTESEKGGGRGGRMAEREKRKEKEKDETKREMLRSLERRVHEKTKEFDRSREGTLKK